MSVETIISFFKNAFTQTNTDKDKLRTFESQTNDTLKNIIRSISGKKK